MKPRAMWKVNEIFCSLQGEGYNTGTASVFVRFSGCNLKCNFCDTYHNAGTQMSLPAIIAEINKYPKAPLIVLTGGEPSLVVNDELIRGLKSTGKKIAIETNGTRQLPCGIDWVTLSPKFTFAGEQYFCREQRLPSKMSSILFAPAGANSARRLAALRSPSVPFPSWRTSRRSS